MSDANILVSNCKFQEETGELSAKPKAAKRNGKSVTAKQAANRRSGRGANGRFLPGNSFGPKWKSGECPNPSGRRGSVIDALRSRLEAVRIESDGRTNAELLADMLFDEAIKKGNIQAAREILDRVDGRPRQSLDLMVMRTEREKAELKVRRMMDEAESLGHPITREKAIELLAIEDGGIKRLLLVEGEE